MPESVDTSDGTSQTPSQVLAHHLAAGFPVIKSTLQNLLSLPMSHAPLSFSRLDFFKKDHVHLCEGAQEMHNGCTEQVYSIVPTSLKDRLDVIPRFRVFTEKVCVFVCACAPVCACVHVCLCMCLFVCLRMRVCS